MKRANNHITETTQSEAIQNGRYKMVVMAASRGGIKAVGEILSTLPPDFPVPIAIVLHRTAQQPKYLPQVLGRRTTLRVKLAEAGEPIHSGMVYLAPPNLHFMIHRDGTVKLSNGLRTRHVLSSANPMFTSAAKSLKDRVIAVVLTGGDRDGTDGVQSVREAGGTVIAQDRATSEDYSMPHSAIDTGCVDEVLPLENIGPTLVRLVMSPTNESEYG